MDRSEDWNRKLKTYRRLFHRHPEPGWLTFFSTIFLADHLMRAGYEVFVGKEVLRDEVLMDVPDGEQIRQYETMARKTALEAGILDADKWLIRMEHETGVIAIMDTGKEGLVRAYRFDMDALAVEESAEQSRKPVQEHFCSENPGVSHACGHDGHMALGLTLAERLVAEKKQLSGKFIFIFQPAEEGVRGAVAFCHQWRLGKIDRLFCCHIGFAPEDVFVAGAKGFLATSKFDVRFFGKSAHAGLAPERGKNALLAAASAMVSMQKIKKPEGGVTRLNVGQLRGGESRNTIPAYAWMQVETRGETKELNEYMREQALECIKRSAKECGVRYEILYQGESVSASSDERLAGQVMDLAKQCGEFRDYLLTKDFGASDDGAVFMDMVQHQGGEAAFLLFGTKIRALHHEPEFDFSEDILPKAFSVLYRTACE